MRVFLNLCAGLDELGLRYRVNDFRHIRRNPDETACIIGKPGLLDTIKWRNPMVFGAAIYSHPIERPTLMSEFPKMRRLLVPGEWMRRMCEPFWGDKVRVWPVGIDTKRWSPHGTVEKDIDVLIYDKIRWRREEVVPLLLEPVRNTLRKAKLRIHEIRYGSYREEEFELLLQRSRSMVFLCEHETQGIAYQQALSCDVPIVAWDHGGFWQDPSFYPARVRFEPVTSVPYWDDRCGMRFQRAEDFEGVFAAFFAAVRASLFSPRSYIQENLALANCAREYAELVREVES